MITFVAARYVSPIDDPVLGLTGIIWSTDFELLSIKDDVLYARMITVDAPMKFDAKTGIGIEHSFNIPSERLEALKDEYAKVNGTHC